MKFNKSIFKRFLILMFICLLYPYFKLRQTNNFVSFVDALTIEGFVLLVMGLVTRLIRSGAFSALGFTASKKFFHYNKDYDSYVKDNNSNKPFNYTLFLGIYCILFSIILSFFV